MTTLLEIECEVTDADIYKGVLGSCQFCPIARSAKRALNCSRVHVNNVDIEFSLSDPYLSDGLNDEWLTATLPEAARAFVRAFDASAAGAPFSFTLGLDLDTMSESSRAHFAGRTA